MFIINTKLKEALFDYANVKKLKDNELKLKEAIKKRIDDQLKVQKWLKKAIQQNIGIFEFHNQKFVYDAKSLYLLSYENPLRRGIVWLAEWSWFDNFIILLILLGSACQALNDYSDPNDTTKYNQTLEQITQFTSYCFIVEASIKIIT